MYTEDGLDLLSDDFMEKFVKWDGLSFVYGHQEEFARKYSKYLDWEYVVRGFFHVADRIEDHFSPEFIKEHISEIEAAKTTVGDLISEEGGTKKSYDEWLVERQQRFAEQKNDILE